MSYWNAGDVATVDKMRGWPMADISVYPHSTTISDYSTPIDSIASSNGATTTVNWSTVGNQEQGISSTLHKRVGCLITDTNQRNKNLSWVKVFLRKNASPTGNAIATLRRTSDDVIIATSTTSLDVSTLTTTSTEQQFFFDGSAVTPNENFRVLIEYTGGNSSNYILIQTQGSDTYAGGYLSRYITNYSIDITNNDVKGSMAIATSTSAIDEDTNTKWESASEVNPWLRMELSSSADREPAAMALNIHANTTVTQIKIQTSADGSIWTDKRLINVSALTHGSYNYIRFNRDTAQVRYVRIYGNDGTPKVLAISEVKILMPTESQWNRRHGHVQILATDANLLLSG